jgi:hypothetical protein
MTSKIFQSPKGVQARAIVFEKQLVFSLLGDRKNSVAI